MSEYIFIHGKNAKLSRQELHEVFMKGLVFQQDQFSVVSTDAVIDQKVQNKLGGTVKIAQVFAEDPVDIIEQESQTDKIIFGLSQYGGHERISEVLIGLKKKLKAKGHNARFLNKNFSNITSGQLNKSGLMQKGVDLVRCFYEGKEVWAKTVAFQDIDSYSKRDYDKPRRDMKVGMMPPKLVQMMINFAQPGEGTTIYDPFCGLGTTLMEGMLRGNPVMGSDIKGRLIDSTLKNLTWLKQQFDIAVQLPVNNEQLFQHDATQAFPGKKFPKDLVVVTESYLGPPQSRVPEQNKQEEIFTLLHGINGQFLSGISQIINPGKNLVMCLPYFRSKQEKVFYPEEYIQEYLKNGFELVNDLRSLLYERESQVVGREVMVFKRS